MADTEDAARGTPLFVDCQFTSFKKLEFISIALICGAALAWGWAPPTIEGTG